MRLVVILGNQLFDPEILKSQLKTTQDVKIYMREDRELCTHYKYHKHKLIFFLSSMRRYADELKKSGFDVHYETLSKNLTYEKSLGNYLLKNEVKQVFCFEIEDKFFERRLMETLGKLKVQSTVWDSPMFLTNRKDFKSFVGGKKKLLMGSFYMWQRKRLHILVDNDLKPIGGKWSFDDQNRSSLPKKLVPESPSLFKPSKVENEVMRLIDKEFAEHPGESQNYWIPTDRNRARKWLEQFLKDRFKDFGKYEDALAPNSDFVFHSVLTPFLNSGLLTPIEVVEASLNAAERLEVPLNSLEGFIRQIIGWREFVRGIYQNFSEFQEEKNFWNHKKKLSAHWYEGNTGIAPLDRAIKKTIKFGYSHHIERLMVLGNLMLLLEIDPREAHRWFMEMYVDSSDWVMGPNVYGMALFSDGGIFATKPYICGSNYYKKMGGEMSGDWTDGVDGLYWSFIDRNREFFAANPRLSMMVRTLDRIKPDRKRVIFAAAEKFREQLTC